LTPEDQEKLWGYLCETHAGWNTLYGSRESETKTLWLRAFKDIATYALGYEIVGRMRNAEDWPTLPAFHAAAKLLPPLAYQHTGDVSAEEMAEARAMKVAWLALPAEEREAWGARTMREWGKSGRLGEIEEVTVNGHARVSWWTAEGRAATPARTPRRWCRAARTPGRRGSTTTTRWSCEGGDDMGTTACPSN